jgi:RND family efflux transporter MFP subunit
MATEPPELAPPAAPAPAAEEPAPPVRRSPRIAAILLMLLLIGGGYAGWHYFGKAGAVIEAPPPPAAPPSVTVATPLIKRITEWDEYTGQFAPIQDVEIRARVSGYLQTVNFEDGQLVAAGDLLYTIDPRPFEIALAAAEAQLSAAQASVGLAQSQLKRAEALQKDDFVSRSAYDERLQESKSAFALVGVATAQVEAAKLDLEYTRVLAPTAGRIGATMVDVGNLVTGGNAGNTTLLTTIVSVDPIHLDFDVSESNLLAYQRAITDGRLASPRDAVVRIQARLMDEPDWTLHGALDFIDNQVDRSAGTIRVRAILPNPKGLITPGQFGQVRIPGSEPYEAMLLPEAALVTDQAQKIVLTVAADGTVVAKPVRVGPNRGPQLRIIREGLSPTDRVIIGGLLRARAGAKVTPVEGSFADLRDPEE